MGYVFLLIAVIVAALNSFGSKLYQLNSSYSAKSSLWFTTFSCIAACVIMLVVSKFCLNFKLNSIIIAIIAALLLIINTISQMLAISRGSVGVVMMFMQSGSIIIPLMFGLLFLEEKIKWFHALALVLLLVALALSIKKNNKTENSEKTKKQNLQFLALCILIFIISGSYMVLSKIHQSMPNIMVESQLNTVIYAFAAIVMLVVMVCFSFISKHKLRLIASGAPGDNEEIQVEKLARKAIVLQCVGVLLFAISISVSSLFTLKAASFLPASVMFPIMSGGIIIVSHIVDMLMNRKKPTINILVSIGLCVVAIIIFAF